MRVPHIIGLVAVASLLPLAARRPQAPSAEETVKATRARCAEAVQQVRQYRRPGGVETIGELVDSATEFLGSRAGQVRDPGPLRLRPLPADRPQRLPDHTRLAVRRARRLAVGRGRLAAPPPRPALRPAWRGPTMSWAR